MRFSRGGFMAGALGGLLAGKLGARGAMAAGAKGNLVRMSTSEALKRLMDGNARYRSGKTLHGDHTARRDEVREGQHPFALILSCADSRVPAELVFDQSLGDLFVVRVAGNFVFDSGIGSFEYAVANMAPSILMVMGHTKCGAVQATVDAVKSGQTEFPGKIGTLVEAVIPAVKAVQGHPGDIYANATKENVKLNVAKLRAQKPLIAEAAAAGKLDLVGAIYDIDTGEVRLL